MSLVHLHPLSPDEVPPAPRGRRPRAPTQDGASAATLKTHNASDGDQTLPRKPSTASLSTQRSPRLAPSQPPRFVVAPPYDTNYLVPPSPTAPTTRLRRASEVHSPVAAHVLAHTWHAYSDEAIQSAIAQLSAVDSPSDTDPHPYHTALRILSSAFHNLSRARRELEQDRRLLEEKQEAGKRRAETLLQALLPSEQEVARRVIQSVFTDDDERRHCVQRQESLSVRVAFSSSSTSLTLFCLVLEDIPYRGPRGPGAAEPG